MLSNLTSDFQGKYLVYCNDSNAWPESQAMFNPIPDDRISDWSKLKQFADDISKHISSKKISAI